jgi:7-carboxy-7-deazaguanine synthase
MKKYTVKEIFYTLQGEGYNAGKAAIFCRFSGCNLWNGKEKDRKKSICSFCDTDFLGTNGVLGGQYTLESLVNNIIKLWPNFKKNKFIVFTGGEPLLQLDSLLINSLKTNKFKIAVETNGTILPPQGIDWVCVSPKVKSNFIIKEANEIKVVYPQENLDPKIYEKLNFDHFYIQPLYNKYWKENNKEAIKFILNNPSWKLSIQSHKYIGVK